MIEINVWNIVLNLKTYVLLAGIYEALGLVRFCLRKPLFYHDEQKFTVSFLQMCTDLWWVEQEFNILICFVDVSSHDFIEFAHVKY